MKVTYDERAERILKALDNSKAPISWHCIDEPELVRAISRELRKIDKEEADA